MTEFNNTYQKLLFSAKGNLANDRADIQRKCTALMYNESLKNSDERTTCHLLKQNLNKYYDIKDEDSLSNTNLQTERLKHILQSRNTHGGAIKSNLASVDLKSMLISLKCTKDDITCSKSENVTRADFRQFINKFSAKKITSKAIKPILKMSRSNSGEASSSQVPKSDNSRFQRNSSYDSSSNNVVGFKSALEVLEIQQLKKKQCLNSNSMPRRTLGMRRHLSSKFVPPMKVKTTEEQTINSMDEEMDPRLKSIDPKMIELIKSEIMDVGPTIQWSDIAGLNFAKTTIQEAVVWPILRPDIFTGLRRPPKGILLFGPPGTGKTLIGKCVASQSKSTFFSISASSLTSKWIGDGEKMVRALFAVARCHQPAVIFIDEIDSLLMQRSESEHESSRRIKTEFLIQLDGATTDNDERLLVIGATNRPQELDEAARRRLVKRLYIPLPDHEARLELVTRLISSERNQLNEENLKEISRLSDGYSGADIKNLCSEAALGPIRSIDISMFENIRPEDVRPVRMEDFANALQRVRSSVSTKDLDPYNEWDKTYGSGI